MSSRADFLREMGISEEDIQSPSSSNIIPETKNTTPSTLYGRRSSASSSGSGLAQSSSTRGVLMNESPRGSTMAAEPHLGAPPIPPVRRTTPRGSGNDVTPSSQSVASRKGFLESLGLSEADINGGIMPTDRASTIGNHRTKHQQESDYESVPWNVNHDNDEFPSMPKGANATSESVPTAQKRKSSRVKVPIDRELDEAASKIPTTATSEQLKVFGNKYYELGDFRKAIRYYSSAIKLEDGNAVLYSNRSAAYLQGSEQMGVDTTSIALRDAIKATELRPEWSKAWTRKADALLQLERIKEAIETFEKVLTLDPGNQRAEDQLARCRVGCYGKGRTGDGGENRTNTPRANLQTLVETLNSDLTSQRKMSGKAYLETELDKYRSQRKDSGQENFHPSSMDMRRETGFDSTMAQSYKDNLLNTYRTRLSSSSGRQR